MKKSLYIVIIVIIAISCNKVSDQYLQEGQDITITASHADNQTKTTLQDGGTSVYWEPGDEVKLFYDGTGASFVAQCTSPSITSKFSGTMNVMFGFDEGFSDNTPLWGLYPYRADAISDNSSVTTTLPSDQVGRADSFANGANISLAKSTSLSMGFYNVCGGLRFSLTNSNVNEVVFESLGDESIAGKIKLCFEGGVPVVQEITEGVSSITLTAPNSSTFETGKWYYIVALPVALSSGFKMTLNTETHYATLKSSSSVSFKRGVFGSLADVDKELTYKAKPTGKNIHFEDDVAKSACVVKFDTDKDGEISYEEAAAVTTIENLFEDYNTIKSFNELQYFTGISNMSQAMQGLTQLESVIIPENVTSVESNAFDGCSALVSLTFSGNKVVSIDNYAFSGCEKLESVDFPSSLNSIGQYAFQNCKSIKTINLPNSVSSLGNNAFSDCNSLESATLPSNLSSIPSGTFSGCVSLVNLTFPSSLTTIEDEAFRYCSFINKSYKSSKIELPTTVTTIGSRSFGNARKIIIPSTSYVAIQNNSFSIGICIYVPDAMVESYKNSTNWSNYSDYIFPLSSYSDEPLEMESVDLGLSVKWASCNLGAIKPEDFGTYFAWGDVVGQLWNDGFWSGGGFSTNPSYELDANNNLNPEYDAAHVILGGKWHMPTKAECQELIDNCTLKWTLVGGVYGRLFTSKKTGYKNKSIFLPAAGFGYNTFRNDVGSGGGSWSSSFYEGKRAWILDFGSDGAGMSKYYRYYGWSVRPVLDK